MNLFSRERTSMIKKCVYLKFVKSRRFHEQYVVRATHGVKEKYSSMEMANFISSCGL